ncbi:Rieske 2Fe-2S domain-containing protein [Rhodococcus rhodochrous]|uniref:Rieske 2Fe-2S domain-containing protein n=1 Tax=Rhodococcus rhodochrous TaxID=1829 RepID=UPI001E2F4355|nr:Rieske 2Fe-2S domain-containing protein [Rhodococcus rhodochrous]MCD2097492.1 Rieske 2Fe-2S domain-containing protein [Rhodococcus rhodochrous]MCD2122592.1 Rieske 2Fe-2S domain-containing protein [Rhodococcus rhodochrous]MCQ4133604.1 Rieske 2Fe-2S domain-containing protein [Rhodococcus rhodochrous]MDJ0018108.1 Rieske 2Fe-2S domain-containing protein [Rhodococcus rhodochrous]
MALSMKPTGWFQIGWSTDIQVGDVKPLRYFGHDLVAYRTESGRLVVLNAYCEHLGAHMGHGGTVAGDDIRCPFHGWQWSPEGRNTCIPYQKGTNRVRRIGTWSTAERDGIIYLWHDAEGRDPQYDVPSIFDLFPSCGTADDYHELGEAGRFQSDELPIHPQYAAENGVDFAHFKYVHRADEIPTVVHREFGDTDFKTELALNFKRRSADGSYELVEGRTRASLLGLGLGFSHADGVGSICSLTAVTPVDDEHSILRFSAWASKEDGEDEVRVVKRQRNAVGQLKADIAIWEHQRYTEPPGLATAEAAGFRDIRQWARRFYPEGHLGSGAAEQTAGTDEFQAGNAS